MKSVFSNAFITSVSLKGKVKYGIKDKVKDIKDKYDKRKAERDKKKKDKKDWWEDNVDKENAQNFIRKQGFPRAKVGLVKRIDKKDGANWGVLFGNPADKKYYIWTIHRNGNDLRLMTEDDGYTMERFTNANDCLQTWNELFAEPVEQNPNVTEIPNEEEQRDNQEEQDDVIYAEDDLAPRDDDIILSPDEYEIHDE